MARSRKEVEPFHMQLRNGTKHVKHSKDNGLDKEEAKSLSKEKAGEIVAPFPIDDSILPASDSFDRAIDEANTSLVKSILRRYIQATETYKEESKERNHYMLCISCLMGDFLKNSSRQWCALFIVCPGCLSTGSLALGTNLSDDNIQYLLAEAVPSASLSFFTYSDKVVRSLAGVLNHIFAGNIEGFKTRPGRFLSSTYAPTLAETLHNPSCEHDERLEPNLLYMADRLDADGKRELAQCESWYAFKDLQQFRRWF